MTRSVLDPPRPSGQQSVWDPVYCTLYHCTLRRRGLKISSTGPTWSRVRTMLFFSCQELISTEKTHRIRAQHVPANKKKRPPRGLVTKCCGSRKTYNPVQILALAQGKRTSTTFVRHTPCHRMAVARGIRTITAARLEPDNLQASI